MNFSDHSHALRDHILSGLQHASPQEQAQFSKFCRTLNQGLQATALALGADDELSDENKGKYITMVSMLNTSITEAFALDTNSKTLPTLQALER